MRKYVICLAFALLGTMTEMAAAKVSSDLEVAIRRGNSTTFDRLLPKIADVNEPFNPLGENALTLAAYNGRYEMVSVLLELGAEVDHRTKNGYTALIYAAMVVHGRAEDACRTVRALLTAGANASLRNFDGQTARDLALRKDMDLAEMLKFGN